MSEVEAVESLVDLGLTEYEARCFVALVQLSDGTAKEVSQVADVPQSRVYDVAEKLHRRGLVDVQESDPQRYYALPVDQALERLHRSYTDDLDAAEDRLRALEARRTDSDGVWEIADATDVRVRTAVHIREATDAVYLLLGTADHVEPDLLEALRTAGDAGASVYVEVPSAATRDRLHAAVPDCHVAVTDLSAGSAGSRDPGRLLLADDTVLLSALSEGLVPGETEESGVWGSEDGHGLVAWLRPLLADRRRRLEFETT